MKHVLKWILVLIVIFVGWLGILYSFQTKIIFPAVKEYVQHPLPKSLEWENVSFRTSDDVLLHGWWFDGGHEETVLFFHGNATNISHYTGRLYMLEKLKKNVLFFDYRGYGRSKGRVRKEEDVYIDGQAAIDFLVNTKQIPPQHISLWGFSIGTGVAMEMALRNPVSTLILEAPFLSVKKLAKTHVPFPPLEWLLRYKLNNEEKITELTIPLLILHSPDDQQVPFTHGQQLFEKAKTEKQLVELSGDHDEAISKSASLYFSELQDFLP